MKTNKQYFSVVHAHKQAETELCTST